MDLAVYFCRNSVKAHDALGNQVLVLGRNRAMPVVGMAVLLFTHEPERGLVLVDLVAVLT